MCASHVEGPHEAASVDVGRWHEIVSCAEIASSISQKSLLVAYD